MFMAVGVAFLNIHDTKDNVSSTARKTTVAHFNL